MATPTTEEEFEDFLKKCCTDGVSPNQKQHLRMAFYAGTLSNIAYVVETCRNSNADEVVRVLTSKLSECHGFMLNRVATDFINKLLEPFKPKPENPFMDGPRRN